MMTETIQNKNLKEAVSNADPLMEEGFNYFDWWSGDLLYGKYDLVQHDIIMIDRENYIFTSCSHGWEADVIQAYDRFLSLKDIEDPLERLVTKMKYFRIRDVKDVCQQIRDIVKTQ